MAETCNASSIAQLADGLRNLLGAFFDASSNEAVAQKLQQAPCDSIVGSMNEYISDVMVPRIVQSLDKMMFLLAEDGNNAAGVPLLSVQNLRLVYTAIEVLWQSSICATVHKQADFVLPTSAYPSSLLIPKKTMDCLAEASTGCAVSEVYAQIECMRKVVCDDTFSGLMLQRNLDRILLTYYTLALPQPDGSLHAHSAMATAELQSLAEGPFASMIVTKLRGFTRGPAWLRDASLSTLTSILQGKGGLETVLSGYLEGSLDSAHAAALQAHVAKLVTSPPAGADKAQYLQNMGSQALDLVLYGLFKNDKTLLRVCVLIITRLCIVAPELCATTVLGPLFAPILSVPVDSVDSTAGDSVYGNYLHPTNNNSLSEQAQIRNPAVVFDALTVQAAVELLHTLLTICPLNRALLDCLATQGVDTALLRLYGALMQQTSGDGSTTSILTTVSTNTGITRTSVKVDIKLFSTVESSCIVWFQYTGVKGLATMERQLFVTSGSLSATAFQITTEGLVEVRRVARARSDSDLRMKSNVTDNSDAGGSGADLLRLYNTLPPVVHLLKKLEEAYNKKLAHQKEKLALQSSSASVSTSGAANTATPSSSSGSSSNGKVTAITDNCGYEYIASELFLRCLAGFLRLPSSDVGMDDENISGTSDAGASAECNTESTSSPAQYGVVIMLLQEQLPLPMLLRDGLQILKLIRTFVEHYAATMQSGEEHLSQGIPLETFVHVEENAGRLPMKKDPAPSSVTAAKSSKRRPLIQVLSSEDHPAAQSVPAPDDLASNPQTEAVTEAEDQSELIECVLGLLAGILGLGEQRRTTEEEVLIRSLVAPLQIIAFRRPPTRAAVADGVHEDSTAETASDVALMILSRSYHLSHPTTAKQAPSLTAEEHSSDEPFTQVLDRMRSAEYLFSDSPAMRGYGTRILLQHARLRARLLSKESKLTESDAQSALDALLPLLSDQESFVYLNTLTVLRELGEHQPQLVFTALLHIFAGSEARRGMAGEALALLLGRANRSKRTRPAFHQQVVQMLPPLVQVCLKLAQQRPSQQDSAAVQASINLLDMRIKNSVSTADTGDSDGSGDHDGLATLDAACSTSVVQFPSSTEIAKQAAHGAQLEGAALAADRDILRQSAVSLLAEAVSTAGPAAYRYLDDILDMAVGMLQMETAHDQSSRAARRSAAFLASHTISTLHSSIRPVDMLSGKGRTFDSFQRVYEALQRTALDDKDEIAKYHASTGLFALQDIYTEQFAALGGVDTTASVGSIDSAVMQKFCFDLR